MIRKVRCKRCGQWRPANTIKHHRGSKSCVKQQRVNYVRRGITAAAERAWNRANPFVVRVFHPGARVVKTFQRWEDASFFAARARQNWGASFVTVE